MTDWYIKGGSTYDDAEYAMWVFVNDAGFDEDLYETIDFLTDGDADDPFWAIGIDTQTDAKGVKQVEIGLKDGVRIKINTGGISYWDGAAWRIFAGIGAHNHDGETLQLDAVNSDGGAFPFTTTGAVTFNQAVNTGALDVTGNITVSGTVDGIDVAARDHAATVAGDLNHNDLANLNAGDVYEHISAVQLAALHTAVVAGDLNHNDLANIDAGDINHLTDVQVAALHGLPALTDIDGGNWKVIHTNATGDVIELALGADGKYLMSNGPAVAPTFEAVIVPTKGYDTLPMYPLASTYFADEYVKLTAVGQYFSVFFYLDPDVVDTGADLVFTFIFRGVEDDAAVAFQLYVGSNPINNTTGLTFNIENAAAINIDSSNANDIGNYVYTVANANIDDSEVVQVRLRLNEAARNMWFVSAGVKYTLT